VEARRFELIDEKSSKYWEIHTDDRDILMTTSFGRIGNSAQVKVKEFESLEDMNKKVENIIRSKIKKGYVEVV